MPRARRTAYLFFYLEDGGFFDLNMLLRGVVKVDSVSRILALSILGGQEYPLSAEDLQLLMDTPSDRWVSTAEIGGSSVEPRIRELASKGLLLVDESEEFAEFRRRDEILSSSDWNVYAALFHFLTKWQDADVSVALPEDPSDPGKMEEVGELNEESLRRLVGKFGNPPSHFHGLPNPLRVHDLPLNKRHGGLYDALEKRKTTRMFDRNCPVTLDQISTVLYYVFGCHGTATVSPPDLIAIKRTSPSGGGLHPIEAYPLIINVDGLDPGLYHYRVEDHSLELLEGLSSHEASELANVFTAGQSYPRTAGGLIVMVARFYRNFWKYRRHNKAYPVLLMDAAHLSQTHYLVCAELGLGAFVTGAFNTVNIEERLQLDGFSEGPVLISGFGVPAERHLGWEPEFQAYTPRKARL